MINNPEISMPPILAPILPILTSQDSPVGGRRARGADMSAAISKAAHVHPEIHDIRDGYVVSQRIGSIELYLRLILATR